MEKRYTILNKNSSLYKPGGPGKGGKIMPKYFIQDRQKEEAFHIDPWEWDELKEIMIK